MGYRLSFTTDPMDVCINNYEAYRFNYIGWSISDKYIFNEKTPRHSHYSIIVTSPMIIKERELYNYSSKGQSLANIITSLIPFCGLPSLISQKTHDYLSNRSVFVFDSSPSGWKTNFAEIRKDFEVSKGHGLMTSSLSVEVKGYAIIDESPLKDLEVMITKYEYISEEAKYLIFLNNSIISSANSNVFMLMGKALEIINAMYPLEAKTDRRIEVFFPELVNIFGNYTIKKLFDLSNNRKETRHYIKDKKNKEKLVSHESLSEEERIMMYKCTTCLITNAIREQFGLPRPHFDFS